MKYTKNKDPGIFSANSNAHRRKSEAGNESNLVFNINLTSLPKRLWEANMADAESTKDWRDLKTSEMPEELKNRCFACGSPVQWPHDICDSCHKLAELNCS